MDIKTPWYTFQGPDGNVYLNDANGNEIAGCDPDDEINVAQLEAAKDCVNACSGLNPEAIPDLVAAVEKLVSTTCELLPEDYPDFYEEFSAIEDALAKVKEGRG